VRIHREWGKHRGVFKREEEEKGGSKKSTTMPGKEWRAA
jgi:hypothetical protein